MVSVPPLAFQHRSFGLRTHAKGTAGAHRRYITRPNAWTHFEAENMPSSRSAAIPFFDQLASRPGERKDARVCDKFMIALPAALSPTARHAAVRSFMHRMGHGRIAWCAAFHDTGDDAGNPHAHIVFRDRDIATNRRVIGTSAGGGEARKARQNGMATPPRITPEILRHMWREHLAIVFAPPTPLAEASLHP